MALPPEQLNTGDALPVYHYQVNIETASLAFSEISGLERSFDPLGYPESRAPSGLPKPVHLTLRKGLVRSSSMAVLYDWMESTERNRVEKKDVTVRLCDEQGASVVRWKVLGAFPTKLTAPTFSATANEVAIEALELMASGLEMSES